MPSSHPWEALFVPELVFRLPGPWRTRQVVPRWQVAKPARWEETGVEMSDGRGLGRSARLRAPGTTDATALKCGFVLTQQPSCLLLFFPNEPH